MFKCKNCGGFIYEEETFYDENDTKIQGLGCYQCSHKSYIAFGDWKKFKEKIAKATKKSV